VKKQNRSNLLTEVVFGRGSTDLSDDAKQVLRDTLAKVKSEGKTIKDITVISWADKEYPPEHKGQLDPNERRLADDRNATIRDFMIDGGAPTDFKKINMAEQPDALEKLIKTSPNVKVKKSLEDAGVAHPYRTGMPLKASHAMILIDLN
jgi:hypothetical protein